MLLLYAPFNPKRNYIPLYPPSKGDLRKCLEAKLLKTLNDPDLSFRAIPLHQYAFL